MFTSENSAVSITTAIGIRSEISMIAPTLKPRILWVIVTTSPPTVRFFFSRREVTPAPSKLGPTSRSDVSRLAQHVFGNMRRLASAFTLSLNTRSSSVGSILPRFSRIASTLTGPTRSLPGLRLYWLRCDTPLLI